MYRYEDLPKPEPGYIKPIKIKQAVPVPLLPSGEKITILTLFKKGRVEFNKKEFTSRYVQVLYNQIKTNLKDRPFDFICITDSVEEVSKIEGVITIPSILNLPTKYCKFEIHRPDVHEQIKTEQIFYTDLDVVIKGNLNNLFSFGGNFISLKHPHLKQYPMGGFLSFKRNELTYLYTKFVSNLKTNVKHYPIYNGRGDQLWMYRHCKYIPLHWNDVFPNDRVINWREFLINPNLEEDDVKIVFFSGRETPERNINHPLIKRFWL